MLSPILTFWRPRFTYPLALLGASTAAALAAAGLYLVATEGDLRYHLGGWPPPLGIELVLDSLSAFVAVVVSGVGLVALVYSRRSLLAEVPGKFSAFYGVALLLLAGLLGIAVTGDLFNLYVFLEISSLSAYALLAIGARAAPFATFRYIIMGTIGGISYLLGVGFLYFSTGTLNMADIADLLPPLTESRAVIAAVALIVMGLGLKMALFPLHMWLPDAYTFAASSVSGLIAPIMTKVAAYALIRVLLTVFPLEFVRSDLPATTIIGWLAAVGIIWGSIMAIAQKDFRRMLAYSSVSQLAYIGLGIGLANPLGLIGALFQILSHAVTKGCLFLAAGGIRFKTGLVGIPSFVGLGRKMPWTTAAVVVAALSMVGIPPMSGFFAKWYLVLGSVDAGNWIFVGVIVASSLLNAVYFFRVLERAYLGEEETADTDGHPAGAFEETQRVPRARELPASMLWPILVLAGAIIVVGLLNTFIIEGFLEPALPTGL